MPEEENKKKKLSIVIWQPTTAAASEQNPVAEQTTNFAERLTMESSASVESSKTTSRQSDHQLRVEGDAVSCNETGNYERRGSPSGQQLNYGQQSTTVYEPAGFQVKATKSVLFDTRSTTHAHHKKVQSGKESILIFYLACHCQYLHREGNHLFTMTKNVCKQQTFR